MRERQHTIPQVFEGLGITPARAGKTRVPGSPDPRRRDHPRSCGKDQNQKLSLLTEVGSPPLVRERRHETADGQGQRRITPARAGKTVAVRHPVPDFEDHPRSCGKD